MSSINKNIDTIKELLKTKNIDKKEILKELLNIEKKSAGLLWECSDEILSEYEVIEDYSKRITKVNDLYNLMIEGDNLYALNWLLNDFAGKIDVISIDPPYNSLKSAYRYLDRRSNKNDVWKHSEWISFMYNRLILAKELLSDDGIMFINIDDNELYQLKLLCDEIFGERNFVANLIWKNRIGSNDSKNNLSINHEYVLIYKKKNVIKFKGKPKDLNMYKNPDNDHRGNWKLEDLTCNKSKDERPSLYYDLIDKSTGEVYHCNPNRVWAYSKETMQKLIDEDCIIFKGSGKIPKRKKFVSDLRSTTMPVSSLMPNDLFSNNTSLNEILGSKQFAYPKPIKLIKELISYIPNKDIIALDFFAGSGTLGQAILELNEEDNGNRRFILCTNNENNICEEVTYERIKRLINGYTSLSNKQVSGLNSNLKYYKIEIKKED